MKLNLSRGVTVMANLSRGASRSRTHLGFDIDTILSSVSMKLSSLGLYLSSRCIDHASGLVDHL